VKAILSVTDKITEQIVFHVLGKGDVNGTENKNE
jgi:hypothetical protein